MFDHNLTGIEHGITVLTNEFGLVAGDQNTAHHMTAAFDDRLSALFNSWYEWAGLELQQRFGFDHIPEQGIEVK